MRVDLRTVDGLMAARAPAGSAVQESGVVRVADEDGAGRRLLLEMAAQAKRLVARDEQPRVHAAVRIVAGGAALAHGLMLEDEGTRLRDVAAGADLIRRENIGSGALDDRAFMRIMAIDAADLAFEDRMVRRQVELALLVEMALETSLG